MKRLSSLDKIVLIAITFSILAYPTLTVTASAQHFVPMVDVSNAQFGTIAAATETLCVITTENVTMLNDGRSLVTLLTVVPSSPLADIYRKSLGVLTPTDGESQIPEKKTEIVDVVGNVTEIGISNRESFYRGIEQEQSLFLGGILEIFNSRMTPHGDKDDFWVSVSAFASLQIINSTNVGSDMVQEIGIGPMNREATNALSRFLFSKITFIQMMLTSLEGQQVYDYTWITRISSPSHGTLLNSDELDGLNWEMDFGGGTRMVASVSIDHASTVIINERTLVSENGITATPEVLLEDFSTYKTFNLRCKLPGSASIHSEPPTSAGVWSYSWDYPLWSQSIELTFSQGTLSATLTVTPSLTISGYVGWDFDLGGLNWFEAWMSVTASINVEFEATATASYSYTFQHTLFEWKTTYSFWVGLVPVWADLQFTSSASLTIGAYAKISFYAQAEAQATFKAGFKWTRSNGWSGISEVTTSASKTDPNISALAAGASARAAIQFRLAFLFYGVAGPFVECETDANAAITYIHPNGSWEVSVNLKVVAGSTFAGWLKNLLGLGDWSTVIYERQLASWNGNWGAGANLVYLESACDKLQYGSSWSKVNESSSWSDLLMKASATSPMDGILYGPYISKEWNGQSILGKPYIATFRLKVSSNMSYGNVVYIDIGYNGGSVLKSKTIKASDFASPNIWQDFQLTFVVPLSLNPHAGLEFRVKNLNTGVTNVYADCITVMRGWNSSTAYFEATYNKRVHGSSWSGVSDALSFSGLVMKASTSSPMDGILYGPYISKEWNGISMLGKPYTATFRLKVTSKVSPNNVVYVDIGYNAGLVLKSRVLKASDFTSSNVWQDFQLAFVVPLSLNPATGLEFRVKNLNTGTTDVFADCITVSQAWDLTTAYFEGACNKLAYGGSWFAANDAYSFSGIVMKASTASPMDGILYGPYISGEWGGQSMVGKPYVATFRLKVSSNAPSNNVVYIDVGYNGGHVLQSKVLKASDFVASNAWQDFQLLLVVPTSLNPACALEFRIKNLNAGITDVYADYIVIGHGWNGSIAYFEKACNKRVYASSWLQVNDVSSFSGLVMRALATSPMDGILYGPYIANEWNGQRMLGKPYVATFRLKVSSNTLPSDVLYVDICCNGGNVLHSRMIKATDFASLDAWQDFRLTFVVPLSLNLGCPLEFRIKNLNTGIADLYADCITITQAWDVSTVYFEGAFNKRVYGSSWSATNDVSSFSGTVMRASASSPMDGILYGPYISNEWGGQSMMGNEYEATFRLKVSSNVAPNNMLYIDIGYNGGQVLQSRALKANDFTSSSVWQDFKLTFTVPFSLNPACALEFRVRNLNTGITDAFADCITITRT